MPVIRIFAHVNRLVSGRAEKAQLTSCHKPHDKEAIQDCLVADRLLEDARLIEPAVAAAVSSRRKSARAKKPPALKRATK